MDCFFRTIGGVVRRKEEWKGGMVGIFDAHDEISVGNILARVIVWIRNGN